MAHDSSELAVDREAQKLFDTIQTYAPAANLHRIKEAYVFAKGAHGSQLRKSGEPYIMHPLRTAFILTKLHLDEETISAALMHDVPEDTEVPIEAIEQRFGGTIAYLVDGVTKLSKVKYQHSMELRQIESLQKLFFHSAEDLRAILIKLADRLDNMRTLQFIAKKEKRERIATETLEVYVPIANLLGIGEIRIELEDLCFRELHPQEYAQVKMQVEELIEQRNFMLEEMTLLVKKEFEKEKIPVEVYGRPKSFYSIFRKLQIKKNLYNIDDLIAIRVIVPTRANCYQALYIIHTLFKPKTSRFKDYIAVPKPNGYQSLHTTVFGLSGTIVEFQIRTNYMHLEAEYGVAAHYFYKYSDTESITGALEQRGMWVARILDIAKQQRDASSFLEHLKLDVFQDRIFVFSPRGEVIDLPRGASALDFAYAIHSEVGNHAARSEINGIKATITTMLATGDTVHIITDHTLHPEPDWLNVVKTTLAMGKIREYLSRQTHDEKIQSGWSILEREFTRVGKNIQQYLSEKQFKKIAPALPYKNTEELALAIGEGTLTLSELFAVIFGEKKNHSATHQHDEAARVWLRIKGNNTENQFRDILTTLSALHVPVIKFVVKPSEKGASHTCWLTVIVKNYSELTQVFESIEHLECVTEITRIFLMEELRPYVTAGILALTITTGMLVVRGGFTKWTMIVLLAVSTCSFVALLFTNRFRIAGYMRKVKAFPQEKLER